MERAGSDDIILHHCSAETPYCEYIHNHSFVHCCTLPTQRLQPKQYTALIALKHWKCACPLMKGKHRSKNTAIQIQHRNVLRKYTMECSQPPWPPGSSSFWEQQQCYSSHRPQLLRTLARLPQAIPALPTEQFPEQYLISIYPNVFSWRNIPIYYKRKHFTLHGSKQPHKTCGHLLQLYMIDHGHSTLSNMLPILRVCSLAHLNKCLAVRSDKTSFWVM